MRSFLLTMVWVMCAAAGAFAQTDGPGDFTFVLLHNNDGESSLGNIDHFASVLGTERAAAEAAGLPSVFVSSGDNMLAGAILGLGRGHDMALSEENRLAADGEGG